MRNIKIIIMSLFITSILAGCTEFTEALSGIDNQAQKAASALTPEALTAKSIKLEYKNENYTIDELFTTILRDTQWEYEKNNNFQIFTIKGTWKEGLFEEYHFTDDIKNDLPVNGKVTVILEIENSQILADKTEVKMTLNEKLLVDEHGEKAQEKLYEAFILR